MKVMLIFPPMILKQRYAHNVGEAGGHLPPLGLLYIAAILEKAGHEVQVVDAHAEDLTIEQLLQKISEFLPQFIGISAITSLINKTEELCKSIKQRFPEIIIFIGGPHPTALPNNVLSRTGADIVITEEAESVIADVVAHFEKYKEQKIVRAGTVKNLDALPFPARHLVRLEKYSALPNNYKLTPRSIHVIASRGCPYGCTFCFDANSGFRQRSVANVIAELKFLKEKHNAVEISFWDDTFTVNRKWVMEFCGAMIREKMNLLWGAYSRPDLLDESLLKKMKEAGCWTIFLGIETNVQELLDNVKKKMNAGKTKEKTDLIKSLGIEIRGSFLMGIPGETPELARKTIAFAIELDPDYAQFSLATPYPGTELYKEASKWGTLNETFDEFHGWSPVFVPKGYRDLEELKALNREAFRKFYLRPKFILKKFFKIRTLTDIKRYWKGIRFVLGMAR